MKLANEFLLRIKLIFFLSLFYSLIFSYYSLELLQFLIEFVSTKINFEIMLTQVEDLSIMLLDLINYSLLLFLSFIFITQLYIFFEPSFFNLEKTKINQLLRLTFIGFLVTLLFFINFFNNIYEFYVYQITFLNYGFVSTKIMIDLKKLLNFFFLFVKVVFIIFLPFNAFLVTFLEEIKQYFTVSLKWIFLFNFFLFLYLYLFDFLGTTNILHLSLFYFVQLLQLKALYSLKLFFFSNF